MEYHEVLADRKDRNWANQTLGLEKKMLQAEIKVQYAARDMQTDGTDVKAFLQFRGRIETGWQFFLSSTLDVFSNDVTHSSFKDCLLRILIRHFSIRFC